jgi:APA family basic amino acid/polyamine antiporter
MSVDGLLPKFLVIYMLQIEHLIKQIFFYGIQYICGLCSVSDLGHMVSIGTLFAFSLVCIGVIVMRKTNPDAERGFRVFCSCIPYCRCYYLSNFMAGLPIESWERLAIWMAIGVALYFAYGKKRSKLNNPDK